MKYFTPERLVQLQDRSNVHGPLPALDAWERALEEYGKRLGEVREALPDDFQHLTPLHDARVLDMWWGGRSQFTITLHAETDPAHLVVLTYSLTEPPTVKVDVLPESVRSEPVAWLYDELDLEESEGAAFIHRILLSDGREIGLRFRNATVKRPVPLVPVVPVNGASRLPHSA